MNLDLHDLRQETLKCADSLCGLLPQGAALNAFDANLRLAGNAARQLCECEPAAWGDAPGAIARLLLPHGAPSAKAPTPNMAAASYWALHLFALLCAAPTIQRALIEVAPVIAEAKTLERLQKRLDEVFTAVDEIANAKHKLSPYARITFQLIALHTDLLRAIRDREFVDLRLLEYAASDIEDRAKRIPAKSSAIRFDLLAERANACAWETNRLIHAQRSGATAKRVA